VSAAGRTLSRHQLRAGRGVIDSVPCNDAQVGVTVLIVDDHAEFRRAARQLLEADGLVVVGEAADGDEAISVVATLGPDVVLLDIQLPGLDGFAVADILARSPTPPIVIFISSRDATVYGERLRTPLTRGFIAKSQLSGAAVVALVG
jgi:CheY-like chemotaxis protein